MSPETNNHHEVLEKFSHEELRGMFINLAKMHFGEDLTITPNEDPKSCCPPGSCGVCINGACVKCA